MKIIFVIPNNTFNIVQTMLTDMTVVTQYTAGDEVFLLDNGKVHGYIINYVQIIVYKTEVHIHYDLIGRIDRKFKEKELFSSKEELFKSL